MDDDFDFDLVSRRQEDSRSYSSKGLLSLARFYRHLSRGRRRRAHLRNRPPAPPSASSFDDFGSPPRQTFQDVKVTGDDDIEKFEDQFPELDVGHVRPSLVLIVGVCRPWCGCFADRVAASASEAYVWRSPSVRPRPQASPFSSTPILNQKISEDEPKVISEKRAEEIKQRDEASKQSTRRPSPWPRLPSIFYEEYTAKKERSILENKYIIFCHLAEWITARLDDVVGGRNALFVLSEAG
ncbi:hypothetical protein OG21DRAFT_625305 [Imleria badia]|nr:hypothetical protein OG21DRAFT_625305 [Imleria badia]